MRTRRASRDAAGEPSLGVPEWWLSVRSISARLSPFLSLTLFLVAWWAVATVASNAAILPDPGAVAASLWSLAFSGDLLSNMEPSLLRLAAGFCIAAAVGIPTGFAIATSDLAEDVLDPFIELTRPISGIAWIPLALFVFGVGDILPVFIIFYVAVFPFVINTAAGVRSVDPALLRAARTMGCSRRTIVRQIMAPATVLAVLTGARLAGGGALMGMVAAEFVGASSGLGFAIQWYANLLRTADMLAYVVVTGLLGFVSDRAFQSLQRRLAPWAFRGA